MADDLAVDDLGNWYIVKQESGQCDIFPKTDLPEANLSGENSPEVALPKTAVSEPQRQISQTGITVPSVATQWGPFKSKNQAIAKRIGLIRAGKCQPR